MSDVKTCHYFEFKRGVWQKEGDKPAVHHQASGKTYVNGLTLQERESLDAHINMWFECRDEQKPLTSLDEHVFGMLVSGAKFCERMHSERYCIPDKSFGGADPQLLGMAFRRTARMLGAQLANRPVPSTAPSQCGFDDEVAAMLGYLRDFCKNGLVFGSSTVTQAASLIERLHAAIKASRVQEPVGWQLVPKEPTPQMIAAAMDCPIFRSERESYAEEYKAALDAAPSYTHPINTVEQEK